MKRFYLSLLVLLGSFSLMTAQDFVNPIQMPPLVNADDYHLNVIESMHNFNPNGTDTLNTMVPTFAYEDANNPGTTTVLGPSLTWEFGVDLTPTVTNKLSEVTTCHWHGAHVPQAADGGPHQRIQPQTDWTPSFEVKDKSATMWYHPHAMDLTYRHVQMGLSGMLYVKDTEGVGADDPITTFWDDIFPHEYAVNDFPLIFQTKKFMRNGSGDIVIQADDGYKDGFYYMVNGIVDPELTVPAGMIRLRLLNGDGKFSFNFEFDNADFTNFPVQMIATDAGYMETTHEIERILMAPGERVEVLMDLRGVPEGTVFYIHNRPDIMPTGTIGDGTTGGTDNPVRDLLKIVVGPGNAPVSPIIGFPLNMVPSEAPPLSEVTRERTKTFRKDKFLVDGDTTELFNIDSTLMDMFVVNDVVKLDSTELWTIDNQTNVGHPWHIHDIHFWVTKIIDANGMELVPADHPEYFGGPKDNVYVQPGWKLSYITTFSDYGTEVKFNNSYMYHCHILPHEDRGMMGQFVVWNGEGDPIASTEDPDLSTISMTVYPNPAQDIIYLEGTSTKVSSLKLVDLHGRLLKKLTLPPFDGAIEIPSADLAQGMLIMDWQTEEGRGVSKVMIQR